MLLLLLSDGVIEQNVLNELLYDFCAMYCKIGVQLLFCRICSLQNVSVVKNWWPVEVIKTYGVSNSTIMQQLFSYIFNIYAQHQVVKESTKFRHINTNTCHTCNVI